MSNLLKSKFLLGLMIVATLFLGVTVARAAVAPDASTCQITKTLKKGLKNDTQVKCLQAKLSLTADGSFGNMTKAAVIAYQTTKGLGADGVVGA
ncbi:MAG: peptidoglycan-binding domain-containing protein, partial [bacterium]